MNRCGDWMLYIDDRENDKVKHKILMRLGDSKHDPKGQAQVKRLKSADYIMGQWGIEAKEINDLYRSILGIGRTRTIAGQLADLNASFDVPMLVVYGTELKPWIAGRKGRPTAREIAVERTRMQKTISSFKASFFHRYPNIRFMQVKSMDEFVEWIALNHLQMAVAGKTKAIPPQIKSAPKTLSDAREGALFSISGITQEVAQRLLERFGGLVEVISASRKELMQVEGIGKAKADKILSLKEPYELS